MKILFRFMQAIPSLNRTLEKGPRAVGMIRYKWREGLPFLGDAHGGTSLPQVYCAPVSPRSKNSGVRFTDDVIFARDKVGLFQLVILLDNLHGLDHTRSVILGLDKLSGGYVLSDEATFIVRNALVGGVPSDIDDDVFRLATAEEFAADEILCKGRPVPQYYDMNQISKDLDGKRFVIVRPDRFVYAACHTAAQLQRICEGIPKSLGII